MTRWLPIGIFLVCAVGAWHAAKPASLAQTNEAVPGAARPSFVNTNEVAPARIWLMPPPPVKISEPNSY